MKSVYFYAIIVWILFLVLAVINGIIREEYYPDSLTKLVKHQISSVVFVLVILGIAYVFFNRFSVAYTKKDLWLIGAMWVSFTVIFEFLFGHYVIGHSWSVLFEDYNLLNGRVWLVVLFFIFVGPRIVAKL